jgi:DNA-directed RNA polymerase specialized sigma24 family protein
MTSAMSGGWLVVVTRRLCLDRLGSAEARRTTATAELPEAGQDGVDPADRLTSMTRYAGR